MDNDEVVNDELMHYGVKGMKWGVRRYQNEDGSLTPAGVKRYAKKGYAEDGHVSTARQLNNNARAARKESIKTDRARGGVTIREANRNARSAAKASVARDRAYGSPNTKYKTSTEEENRKRANKYVADKRKEHTKGWSKDAKRTYNLKQKSVKALSNKEIKEVNNRKRLEKEYRDLNPSTLETGMKAVAAIGAAAGTMVTVYNNGDKLIKIGSKVAKRILK